MLKKKLLSFLMIGLFGLATLFSVDAQTAQTVDGVSISIGDADVRPIEPIKCFCKKVGEEIKCKALNHGGDLIRCATGTPDKPNVNCSDYDDNC